MGEPVVPEARDKEFGRSARAYYDGWLFVHHLELY